MSAHLVKNFSKSTRTPNLDFSHYSCPAQPRVSVLYQMETPISVDQLGWILYIYNTSISKGEIKGQYNATRVPSLSIFEILFPPLCPFLLNCWKLSNEIYTQNNVCIDYWLIFGEVYGTVYVKTIRGGTLDRWQEAGAGKLQRQPCRGAARGTCRRKSGKSLRSLQRRSGVGKQEREDGSAAGRPGAGRGTELCPGWHSFFRR